MEEAFSRTERLIGQSNMQILSESRIIVFGIGGVGSYVAEALARCGIGHFLLVDNDTVSESNLNRQLIATHRTIGMDKVLVMRERILDINPKAEVEVRKCFYLPECADTFDFSRYDYVVDAIDTVTAKIDIIVKAKACGTPVISSMGTGNKLDPKKLLVSDIYKTSMCPLAKVMRKELKARKVKNLKVVYSTEQAISVPEDGTERRPVPGSVSFVPSVAGLMIAGEVIRDLIGVTG